MATDKKCIHYFIVEEAKRPTSKGVCTDCGEARVFSNIHIYDNRYIPTLSDSLAFQTKRSKVRQG